MNKNNIIDKFIEYCGGVTSTPFGFVQGVEKYNFGMTTTLGLVWKLLNHSFNEYSPSQILPEPSFELNGQQYWFNESDLLTAMRFLQSKPFSKLKIQYAPNKHCPLTISRADTDVSILLAPNILPISTFEEKKIDEKKYRGNPWRDGKDIPLHWLSQLHPNSTFWIVEFPTWPNSWVAGHYGFPIGRMVKCKSCGAEIDEVTFARNLIERNHPECMCSCDTYDDFCGCRRRRDMREREKKWKEERIKQHFIQRAYWNVA